MTCGLWFPRAHLAHVPRRMSLHISTRLDCLSFRLGGIMVVGLSLITEKPFVMVNFMRHLDWVRGVLDIWSNILGVSLGVLLDEVSI